MVVTCSGVRIQQQEDVACILVQSSAFPQPFSIQCWEAADAGTIDRRPGAGRWNFQGLVVVGAVQPRQALSILQH